MIVFNKKLEVCVNEIHLINDKYKKDLESRRKLISFLKDLQTKQERKINKRQLARKTGEKV